MRLARTRMLMGINLIVSDDMSTALSALMQYFGARLYFAMEYSLASAIDLELLDD